MELNFIIEDAVANPVKFTRDDLPTNERANFDQRRYAQTKNATVDDYKYYNQKFEKTDLIRIQFYSNFPLNRVKVVDCEGVQYGSTLIPTIAVAYRGKKFRASCKFSSINDKLFIYFADSRLYEDEDFLIPGDIVAYGGRLPNINAVPGDIVRYSFDGVEFFSTTITAIQWSPELQAEGYLCAADVTLVNPVDGYVEISYNEKPANLYTQLIGLTGLAPGKYFIKREHGVNGFDYSFTSEPLDVADSHPESLALIYRHVGTYNREDIWNYVYLDDWTNLIRIPADFYKFSPTGELEVDVNDSGIPRILRAIPYRQIDINFLNMPSWLADKLQIALGHDIKIINGYEYEVENFGQFELIDRLDLGTYTVSLRQKNDRTKKTDSFPITLTAEFLPPFHGGVTYAGAVMNSTFATNTLGNFNFVALPSWISVDRINFGNGDILAITAAPNPTLFDRTAVLIAVSNQFDGLSATLTITQNWDPTPPAAFIDATPLAVELNPLAGANDIVNVNASGPYNITYSGAFTFSAAQESGGLVVRITAPTANDTETNRTGVVRLALASNPAIFVEINVTQYGQVGLLSLSESFLYYPSHGGNQSVAVGASASTNWQAISNQTWCIVDGSIKTGPAPIFNVFLNGRDIYTPAPRFAIVTLVNTANPSNTLTIHIRQD